MFGAIVADIVGSTYKGTGWKSKEFPLFPPACRFTDDTVLAVATAEALLNGRDYAAAYRSYARRYPDTGYSASFRAWFESDAAGPYGGWGSDSAARAWPIGWMARTLDEALAEAQRSAEVTHDHPEGIKGAQAVAAGIFLARQGRSKVEIRIFLEQACGYDLTRTLDRIRPHYDFDVSCPGAVPEAIIAFLEAADYKDAVRNAVSLGGDADTQASIAGALAHAFHGEVPAELARAASSILPWELVRVLERFAKRAVH